MSKPFPIARLAAVLLVALGLSTSCTLAPTPTPDVEALARAIANTWATQTAQAAQTRETGPEAAATATTVEITPVEAIGAPPPTSTHTPLLPTATSAPTSTPKPTRTWTPSPTFTPRPTRTPTPSATPLPPCPIAVDPELAAAWQRGTLGCAVGSPAVIWAAWQPFERGYMLWRSDNDWAYVLNFAGGADPTQGAWTTPGDASRWDGSFENGHGLNPPPGKYEPVRGFGYVWFNFLGGPGSAVGWATEPEKGICITLQAFERGLIFRSSTVEFCQDQLMNMARDASFAPLLVVLQNDGAWRRYRAQ